MRAPGIPMLTTLRMIVPFGVKLTDEDGKSKKQNILNTTFTDKFFDGVVLTYVINHFNDEGLKLLKKEIDRILKNNGTIFLSVHVGNEEQYVTDPLD